MDCKWYIKIWIKKKYIDFWSVNHFFSGCILASLFYLIEMPFLKSVVATTILLIIYELYEILRKIHETTINRFIDVIIGMLGFFVTSYLTRENALSAKWFLILIVPLGGLLLCWGLIASKFKKQLHLNEKEP